jgi:hypothetical protein
MKLWEDYCINIVMKFGIGHIALLERFLQMFDTCLYNGSSYFHMKGDSKSLSSKLI